MEESNIITDNQENELRYIVNIDKFTGPLDVLWELIRKSKIDITEVSLAKITEQYLEFLKIMERLDVKLASDFILLASELIYYKSKALLPGGEVEDEYYTQPLPPELIQKLLEYKKFQRVTDEFKTMFERQDNVFVRNNVLTELGDEEYYFDVSLYDLLRAFSNVLNSVASVETAEIVFDEILVSDRIEYIAELLKEKDVILFDEIFSVNPTKAEVIASFLAVLEMTKTRMIKVQQHRVFGDIRIIRNFTIEDIKE
ncbi:MAG TPA: segregation/condensation protein A [Spirochaetota bacterium]|nr:segregation/condensation protein A [Spirochaetota bacterium]HPD78700.1 segregation/condensation protein A [Spirochaetota bacterium]